MSDTRSWPLVEVLDPSMTRGLYLIWAQLDTRTDRWYVSHAAHIDDGPVSVMAEQIKRERRFIGKEPDIAIMDNKGGKHIVDKEVSEDWFTRFRNLGLDYVPNDEPAALEELDEWLKLTYDPVLGKMVAKLSICERVANMEQGPLWALQRFQWDPMMSRKELYQQPGKDYVDCLKYLVNQKSVNRAKLARDRGKNKFRAKKRHEKLANSYGLGGTSNRRQIWSPPTFR